ncbi:MAG TPA: NUDIX domain-containing protein [Candidatus Saccharimonadales bacterium]
MSRLFTVVPIADAQNDNITLTACVGFVALSEQPDKFVVIKNKRGWDIPGGHIESGEEPYEAFQREVLEESGCELLQAQPTVILASNKNRGTGILVYRAVCKLSDFVPTDEISEVRLVTHDELIDMYFGDKELISELFSLSDKGALDK